MTTQDMWDFSNISIDHMISVEEDGNTNTHIPSSEIQKDIHQLETRVEQFQWVVQWLEKHKLLKTLDVLLEEGADIASESFHLSKSVSEVVETGHYAKALLHSYDMHSGQSILSVRFHPNPDLPIIASGSTDRTVAIANWRTGQKLATVFGAHKAPILSLDWNPVIPHRLLLGSVDNSASVVQVSGLESLDPKQIAYKIVANLTGHQKHVVRVCWSPDGKMFATASYDHHMKVFEETSDPEQPYKQIKDVELNEAVECIGWTPDMKWLIATARADNYMHYYEVGSWKETKFNMNANGDDHVSFTAMDFRISKDGKHILVSTDKSRVIVYATATPLITRNFYDMPNGEWCTPHAVWSQDGEYIYVSSDDKGIYIYNVATTEKRLVLTGHTSNVRDLTIHPTLEVIATGSFDKTIKLWQ